MYSNDPSIGCPYNTGKARFTSGSLDKMACSIFGDIVQIAPARMIAQVLANDGVPVYKYRFNHLSSNNSEHWKGISTGTEQAYVFSNNIPTHAWDQNMANLMSTAWISFVHDLDPNTGSVGKQISCFVKYKCKKLSINRRCITKMAQI
jgi:carboxylesterase type B